jgi:hypothetical protein
VARVDRPGSPTDGCGSKMAALAVAAYRVALVVEAVADGKVLVLDRALGRMPTAAPRPLGVVECAHYSCNSDPVPMVRCRAATNDEPSLPDTGTDGHGAPCGWLWQHGSFVEKSGDILVNRFRWANDRQRKGGHGPGDGAVGQHWPSGRAWGAPVG